MGIPECTDLSNWYPQKSNEYITSTKEINDVKTYVNESIHSIITDYQNIIYNENIIGSLLIRTIENGFLFLLGWYNSLFFLLLVFFWL